MVDVAGHLAMALLFAVPAWFVWGRRVTLAYVALTLLAALLPDVDLYLGFLGVHHHGVTHTVLFAVAASVLGGGVVATALTPALRRRWRWGPDRVADRETVFVFATGALLAGGLSHLFADMLSAPDIAQELEPFWPLFVDPISFDVIYYDDPLWNAGLLAVAVAIHLFLFRTQGRRLTTRYRVERR